MKKRLSDRPVSSTALELGIIQKRTEGLKGEGKEGGREGRQVGEQTERRED